MKQLKKTKKTITLKVSPNMFKTKNNQLFTKAAKRVMKTIDEHFKKDKWDLDLGFQVDEVFYEAYGEHLETYLMKELFSNPKKGYYITYSPKLGSPVIRKKRKNV